MRKLNERGAVAAEFALLLPVLLTILFGIIEFGMIMSSAWKLDRRTSKARERLRSENLSRTRCVCDRTGSFSARYVAPRVSICSKP